KIYNNEHPNGFMVYEQTYQEQATMGTQTVTLKSGQYYLLGDNRAVSLDSRIFGPVDRSALIGRVWLRGYPLDRFRVFETPAYVY
ncbi:signal peptidase I, partial [Candidatus Uhrbacteria bacterium]|nr:signal peptidase I [Candidatus Uhrbacteria bacterium]